jgi:pantoate--beta-alanine ligase
MLHIETKADLRAACDDARAEGGAVGLVPTMGALHDGHLSLIRAARAANDFVVVTIFVNPLQFGPNEDFDRYPRALDADLARCRDAGVDCVFSPTVLEMYPRGESLTVVHVNQLTTGLCGATRPTHFDGVTTVVTKLFALVGPSRAYFGRKDAQQLAVVTRMAADLDLPVEVIGCPIVRESDGLALSSRNRYLSAEQRESALILSAALRDGADAAIAGERDTRELVRRIRAIVVCEPVVELEYVEIVDAHDLRPLDALTGDVLIALAAHVGTTRLIDNVTLTVGDDAVTADLGSRLTRAGR